MSENCYRVQIFPPYLQSVNIELFLIELLSYFFFVFSPSFTSWLFCPGAFLVGCQLQKQKKLFSSTVLSYDTFSLFPLPCFFYWCPCSNVGANGRTELLPCLCILNSHYLLLNSCNIKRASFFLSCSPPFSYCADIHIAVSFCFLDFPMINPTAATITTTTTTYYYYC